MNVFLDLLFLVFVNLPGMMKTNLVGKYLINNPCPELFQSTLYIFYFVFLLQSDKQEQG